MAEAAAAAHPEAAEAAESKAPEYVYDAEDQVNFTYTEEDKEDSEFDDDEDEIQRYQDLYTQEEILARVKARRFEPLKANEDRGIRANDAVTQQWYMDSFKKDATAKTKAACELWTLYTDELLRHLSKDILFTDTYRSKARVCVTIQLLMFTIEAFKHWQKNEHTIRNIVDNNPLRLSVVNGGVHLDSHLLFGGVENRGLGMTLSWRLGILTLLKEEAERNVFVQMGLLLSTDLSYVRELIKPLRKDYSKQMTQLHRQSRKLVAEKETREYFERYIQTCPPLRGQIIRHHIEFDVVNFCREFYLALTDACVEVQQICYVYRKSWVKNPSKVDLRAAQVCATVKGSILESHYGQRRCLRLHKGVEVITRAIQHKVTFGLAELEIIVVDGYYKDSDDPEDTWNGQPVLNVYPGDQFRSDPASNLQPLFLRPARGLTLRL